MIIFGSNGNNSELLLSANEGLTQHLLIVGTTGFGKNTTGHRNTTEEDKVLAEKIARERSEKQAKRKKVDMAMKETYWNTNVENFNSLPYELSIFVTIASMILEIDEDEVTEQQAKTVFFEIDSNVFYSGASYGFTDSGVREDINEFYDLKKNHLRQVLNK
ncbi:MAG: hypothetical protein RSD40_04895 [Bacilli bacterium]